MSISPSRPSRLAWLTLLALASLALLLGGGAWTSLQTEGWGTGPRRLVDACLLMSESIADGFWSVTTIHPFSAVALAFLAASMAWAWLRLSLSLAAGWRAGRRLARYEPGRFPALDRVLHMSPEVEPARIRIIRSGTPNAFTIGFLRPKICLSAALLESATAAEIDAILHHEHAHAVARDPLRLAAVRLLSDFLWFLPITRTLARAFSAMAELRADEAAVSAGSDPLELASALVKTAGNASSSFRLAAAIGGLALLEHRIIRLLGREEGTLPLRFRLAPSLSSGLIVIVLLALLVVPAFARARGPALDSLAEMRSMMEHMMMGCGGEKADRLPHSMMASHCADRGHIAAGADRASDGLSGG